MYIYVGASREGDDKLDTEGDHSQDGMKPYACVCLIVVSLMKLRNTHTENIACSFLSTIHMVQCKYCLHYCEGIWTQMYICINSNINLLY